MSETETSESTDEQQSAEEESTASTIDMRELLRPEASLPFNRPEKIVLVVDRAFDGNGSVQSLSVLKQAVHNFIVNKSMIDDRHQFAVVVHNEGIAEWFVGFTGNVDEIEARLVDIQGCQAGEINDISSIFDVIENNVYIERVPENSFLPPSHVVRTILLLTRPQLPVFLSSGSVHRLLTHKYFAVDILLMHDEYSDEVATLIRHLELTVVKQSTLFFKVPRTNHSQVFLDMAKFLAHPLQRAAS